MAVQDRYGMNFGFVDEYDMESQFFQEDRFADDMMISPFSYGSLGGGPRPPIEIRPIDINPSDFQNFDILSPITSTKPTITQPNITVIQNQPVDVGPVPASSEFVQFAKADLNSASQLTVGFGTFQFIVDIGDGRYYTTQSFKNKLVAAEKAGNKYLSVKTAPIIELDGNSLLSYGLRNKFKIGEQYSEVVVTDTISGVDDILIHIDWLVTQGKEFRNTEKGKPISIAGKQIDGIGKWEINHDSEGSFGFEYEEALNRTKEDKVFAEQLGGSFTNDSNITRPNDVTAINTITGIINPNSTTPLFPPFQEAGEPGERKTGPDGYPYFWNPPQNKWRRSDSLSLQDKELLLSVTEPDEFTAYVSYKNDYAVNNPEDLLSQPDDLEQYLDEKLDL